MTVIPIGFAVTVFLSNSFTTYRRRAILFVDLHSLKCLQFCNLKRRMYIYIYFLDSFIIWTETRRDILI